jgi:fatty acid/phospholipid biosynthesis enzyme
VLVTGTRFKTKDFKNPLMLINADKINNESKESYLESVKLFNDYLSKSNKSKDKTYKLLVNDENDETSLIEIFKDDKAFKGLIKIDEITQPNCDFIIGNSTVISAFLSTFKMTFEAIDSIKTDKLNDTFLIKIGKSLTSSVDNQIDRTFDKKTRSYGTILLGFSKPIYFAKNDDTVSSFLDIFEKTIIS